MASALPLTKRISLKFPVFLNQSGAVQLANELPTLVEVTSGGGDGWVNGGELRQPSVRTEVSIGDVSRFGQSFLGLIGAGNCPAGAAYTFVDSRSNGQTRETAKSSLP